MYRISLLALLLILHVAACGTGGGGDSDAAVNPGTHQLLILTPPGRAIGLRPGEQETLRVRYLDPFGVPVAGAAIEFALSGEPRGSTLAGFSAPTDSSGTAEMMLSAGADNTTFTFMVEVSAVDARPITFEIAVSEGGFVDIEVVSSYVGTRSATAFETVSAELYFGGECDALQPAGGSHPDRIRSTPDGFGEVLLFENLPVDLDYALAIRAVSPAGHVLAWGCGEVRSLQLVPGVTLRLNLNAEDVGPSPAGIYKVTSTIELGGPPEALAKALEPVLALGRCPFDPVQRLLDCIADAVVPDGTADCVPEGTGDFLTELETLRGVLDTDDCRRAENGALQPSLEAQLWAATDATGLAQHTALAELAAVDLQDLDTFHIYSQLTVVPNAGGSHYFAWHLLDKLEFPDFAPGHHLPLSQLGNLLLEVASMPTTYSIGDDTTLAIPPHAMTLHARWAALAIAYEEYLTPAGLPADLGQLIDTLLANIRTPNGPGTDVGCAAVTTLLCDLMDPGVTCPPDACEAGVSLLLSAAQLHWSTLLSPSEPDVMFATEIHLVDTDGDLQVDQLGTAQDPSTWLMTLSLDDAWVAPASATFAATRITAP